MNKKASGLDEMIALFYKHYWKIIKSEVIKAMQNFFQCGILLKADKCHLQNHGKQAKNHPSPHHLPTSNGFCLGQKHKRKHNNCPWDVPQPKEKVGKRGLMAIKFDMEKAFVYIEWESLFKVMECEDTTPIG